jgi:hypothetical protein
VNYADKFYNKNWEELNRLLRSLQENRSISPGWKLKTDTSCGGELVSPILIGQAGLREVTIICEKVRAFAKKNNLPATDGECGLHFHFDASDISARQLSNMFVLVHMAEPIIYSIYPNRNWEYCAPIDINMKQASRFRDFTDVRDQWYRGSNNVKKRDTVYPENFINQNSPGEHYDGTRYHGFNIHCYWRQHTVEFRYGSGTFDPIHIRGFYEMCLAIVNTAVNQKSIKADDQILNMKYRDLKNFYSGNYRFRKHILDMAKRCGWSRMTLKLIVGRLRKYNPSLLQKDPALVKIVVDNSNKHRYWFFDVNSDNHFDEMGNRVHLNTSEAMNARRIVHIGVSPVMVEGVRKHQMVSTNRGLVFKTIIHVNPMSNPREILTAHDAGPVQQQANVPVANTAPQATLDSVLGANFTTNNNW